MTVDFDVKHQRFQSRGLVCQSKRLNAGDHIPFFPECKFKPIIIETLKRSLKKRIEKNPDVRSAPSVLLIELNEYFLVNFHQLLFRTLLLTRY